MEKPTRTNIFLTGEDRAAIETIKRAHGLETTSSAVRLALREAARRIDRERRRPSHDAHQEEQP